jgi:hypothetical protein
MELPVCSADPHLGVVTFRAGGIEAVTDGPSAGRTAPSRTGRPIRFGTGADTAVFEQWFLDTLKNRR